MNTNQKPKANTVSRTKTAEYGVRLKNFCLSKVLCIFPFFSKKISSKKQSIASTENSLQFFASKVLVLRKNKTTISRTSSYPFFSYSETLVLGNLFKVFRLAVTELAWEVCDTSQLIWTVQMMRLQGFKRRCWEVSIVGLACRPEFLSLETSYSHCDELSILRDRGRLDRAELPFDTAHGSLHDLPEENYFTPLFFCPCRQQLPTCVNLGTKSILDERWSVGGEELGQRMQWVWEDTYWRRALQLQCI